MSSVFADAMNSQPLRYKQTKIRQNGYALCFLRCYNDDLGSTASSAREVFEWCEQKFGPRTDHWKDKGIQRWGEISMVLIFTNEEDALLFKLTWC